MQTKLPRSIVWAALLFAGALLVPHLARAQVGMPGGVGTSDIFRHSNGPAPARPAPPPALPGARSRDGAPAPAAETPSDMSPNKALFDAINRGDIAAARDALNRGAQLDARNVLGMTPMELAVDLGRNDIAFLLLSERDSGGGSGSAPQPATAAAKPPPGSGHVAAKAAPHHVMVAAQVTAPAVPERPRLFAHDGGTPIPSIGFLGFDPAHGNP